MDKALEMRERVQHGMELLDKQYPGWVGELQLDRLDMSQCGKCILGQLYDRGYYAGLAKLLVSLYDAWWYGFHITDGLEDNPYDEDEEEERYDAYDGKMWLLLERTWKEMIAEREKR